MLALTHAARDLITLAAADAATWSDARRVSQLAVAQQRLGVFCEPFWERIAADGLAVLDVQGAANVLHAYATLAQGGRVATVDAQLCRQLAGVVATASEETVVAQNLSNTCWALGVLAVWPEAQVLASLQTTAAHLAAHMKPQEVSNTLLGLVKLGEPVAVSLQRQLLAAIQRHAGSGGLNAQDVANSLWALSELKWEGVLAASAPAVAALHAAALRCADDMKAARGFKHAARAREARPPRRRRAATRAAARRRAVCLRAERCSVSRTWPTRCGRCRSCSGSMRRRCRSRCSAPLSNWQAA